MLGEYFLQFLHKSVQAKWHLEAQYLYVWVGSWVSSWSGNFQVKQYNETVGVEKGNTDGNYLKLHQGVCNSHSIRFCYV